MELEDDSESDSYYDSQEEEEEEEEFSEERINTQSDLGIQNPTKILCRDNNAETPKSALNVSMSPTLRE